MPLGKSHSIQVFWLHKSTINRGTVIEYTSFTPHKNKDSIDYFLPKDEDVEEEEAEVGAGAEEAEMIQELSKSCWRI